MSQHLGGSNTEGENQIAILLFENYSKFQIFAQSLGLLSYRQQNIAVHLHINEILSNDHQHHHLQCSYSRYIQSLFFFFFAELLAWPTAVCDKIESTTFPPWHSKLHSPCCMITTWPFAYRLRAPTKHNPSFDS